MTYSVWNPAAMVFDYYESPGALRDGVFAPPAPLAGGHSLGLAPDEAARSLPVGAKHVGSGPYAKGLIASRNPLGGLLDGPGKLLLGGLAVWLIWSHVK